MNHPRNISGGIFLIGLALAILMSHEGHGNLFLPIFFCALAFSSLFAARSTPNPYAHYSSYYSFVWMLTLALCFLTGQWILILVGVGLSMLLGGFYRPVMARMGACDTPQGSYQSQKAGYAPSRDPYQQPYETPNQERTYGEGYTTPDRVRPTQQPPIEQPPAEDEDPYAASQYNQPQSQYPQQPPPTM